MVIAHGHISIEILVPDLLHKMVLFQVRATAADGNLVGPPLMVPTEECLVVVEGMLRGPRVRAGAPLGTGGQHLFRGAEPGVDLRDQRGRSQLHLGHDAAGVLKVEE